MPRIGRLRAVPWLLVFEAARTLQHHVTERLTPEERRRVSQILRTSRGRPGAVTPAEREELRSMARKVDLKAVGRDLAPQLMRARMRRRRW